MTEHYIRARVETSGQGGAAPENGRPDHENIISAIVGLTEEDSAGEPGRPVTMGELQQILRTLLSNLRVYVLESDITSSQTAVRTIVEQSQF